MKRGLCIAKQNEMEWSYVTSRGDSLRGITETITQEQDDGVTGISG